jgi:gentisate 1,2-dioxygenase
MVAQAIAAGMTLDAFQDTVIGEHLPPLWMAPMGGLREPQTHIRPYLWRWQHVRQRMLQAGELIPLGSSGAERRVLLLANPGVPADRPVATTHTLVAAVQLVHGTEMAPSHRHTMAALRFVKEGEGAWTVVDGEPVTMAVGDLVLTPNWAWHGHYSEHPEPMLWMDGLDVPFVQALGATFQEGFPSADRSQPLLVARDESMRRYSGSGLLPVGERRGSHNSPLMRYPWAPTEERLHALADRDGSPFDGVALQYTNPYTGGPVMATLDCWMQMLRPGEATRAHRHTASVVYNVARGSGWTVINGQRFDWTAGDVFCLPTWAWHEHVNGSATEEAILFSMNDSTVLYPFDLYREESYPDGDGHQPVSSVFGEAAD